MTNCLHTDKKDRVKNAPHWLACPICGRYLMPDNKGIYQESAVDWLRHRQVIEVIAAFRIPVEQFEDKIHE